METHDTGWRASRPDTARRRLESFLIDWGSRDQAARNQVLSVRLRFGFCILWMAVGFCIPLGFRANDALHDELRAESENPTDAAKDSAPAWEIERRFGRRMFDVAGETLRADVYLPQGEGPFPGVMMIHGGGWVSGSRLNLLAHANAVARAGYVVVAIDYRLAPRHPFPAQLDDCRSALAWMREQSETLRLDADRIAIYGYSAGGHLACLLGFAPVDQEDSAAVPVRAIVAGGAPCDFSWLSPDSRALASVFGETRRDAPERYRDASPLYSASANAPPTLLYHGDADRLVPLATSQRMHERLQELGVTSQLAVVESQGHLAAFLDPRAPLRAVEFLNPILQPPRAPTPAEQKPDGELRDEMHDHDHLRHSLNSSPRPGS